MTATTYTEEQLRSFTDAQILEVFKPMAGDFNEATCDWTHPEYIFIAVYDDVIEDKLTQSEKNEFMKRWMKDFEGEEGHDFTLSFNEFLDECDWLKEDVGCDTWDNPDYVDASLVYMFRFMMDNDFYTEAFVDFLNGMEVS